MNVFIEKCILISGFLISLEVKVLGQVLIYIFDLIISGLDSSWCKFQMLTLFSGRHIGVPWKNTNMAAPYGLWKFVQNISTNMWRSEKRTDLKLGELYQLFISYNFLSLFMSRHFA